MDTQKLWLEITIAGFLYVASAFFVILRILGVNDLTFVGTFLPYLTIAIVVLSYCCGFAINIISHYLIALRWPEFAYNAEDEIELSPGVSDATKRRVTSSYFTLLLFRHLTFGSVLLEDCLTCWLIGTHFNWHVGAVIIPLSTAAVIFGFAFWIHRKNHLALSQYVRQQAQVGST
jgi:hypothetical protein